MKNTTFSSNLGEKCMDLNKGYALLEGVVFRNNTAVEFPVQFQGDDTGVIPNRVFSDDDVTVLNNYGDTQQKSTPVAEIPEFVRSRLLVADDPWFTQTIQVRTIQNRGVPGGLLTCSSFYYPKMTAILIVFRLQDTCHRVAHYTIKVFRAACHDSW